MYASITSVIDFVTSASKNQIVIEDLTIDYSNLTSSSSNAAIRIKGSVSLFSYTYNQQSAASTWNINHNLNYRPGVFATDYGGNIMEGDIIHIDTNNVQLNFSIPVTGYAYLS